MNTFVKNVLATVMAAAICALVAILFQFNDRLARIETKLDLATSGHTVADR